MLGGMTRHAALINHLKHQTDTEAVLEAILDWSQERGLEPYAHQEDAILALLAGENVVLATPTGSGKSLVAIAGAFAMLANRQRTIYTAPIKALVSEKFFELVAELGASNVGMVTGDAAVNAEAPVLVCTAEILANLALREGPNLAVDLVVMDEFHYYGDRDRGWAWQVPLLALPQPRFLLMSATLGDTSELRNDLSTRNGRQTTLIADAPRPVPLDFEYRETPLLETLTELLKAQKTPVYIVHFTQKEATARAQSLTSLDVLNKNEKTAVNEAIGGFRFDTPIGKDILRFIRAGIGVHHAGLLPKYRLLVEKLAQQGLLKLICGTDTLGVGVNVPIRTVLFTQLCKFDGRKVRALTVREFQQISGRAGRRGFDTAGSIVVQAPEHVIDNKRAEAKAVTDPKKRKKLVKKRPPERGYAHWDGDTLARLSGGTPETLKSSFAVSHAMLLNVLARTDDGCTALKRLLTDNHEPRRVQRRQIRKAIAIYRSLLDAKIVEENPLRINIDLQDDFRLNAPLSLFVVEATEALDLSASDHHLQVLSLVESIMEDPMAVLIAQKDRLKDALMNEMKAAGVDYAERLERLDEVTWPKPEAEFIEPAFAIFARHHPWVGRDNVSPKGVLREMFEYAENFNQVVKRYGLKRVEGQLLRYLTDCYKTLLQTVPPAHRNEELEDLIEWLGAMIRRVDSSLIDEWERLRNPPLDQNDVDGIVQSPPTNITSNERAFAVLVRNELFRFVTTLATHGEITPRIQGVDDYFAAHDQIAIDTEARSNRWVNIDLSEGLATQTLCDPEGYMEWVLEAKIDLETSRQEDRAVVIPTRIRQR